MPINKKYLFSCIVLSLCLCGAQVRGSNILVLACLAAYLLILGWGCAKNQTLPILLYFLPWSALMRTSPGSYSFYTFGLVLSCAISIPRNHLRLKRYAVTATIGVMILTLLSKILSGYWLEFSYIAFLMMLVLIPSVKNECRMETYDFYQLTVFLSLGIIVAALCAMFFAASPNIARYIQVFTYQTVIRRCGFYGDANFYTAHITAALAGCMVLLLRETRWRRVLLLLVVSFLLVYCGALSGSKSFVVITGCTVLVWLGDVMKMKQRKILKIVLVLSLIIIVSVVATSVVFQDLLDVLTFRFSKSTDLDSFTTGRIDLWISYIDEIISDVKVFLLGKGYTDTRTNEKYSHNSILQMLYQFGVLGAPFICYWIACFWRDIPVEFRNWKTLDRGFLMVLMGVCLPWLAIDILFFDDFFLLQWYAFMAMYQTAQRSGGDWKGVTQEGHRT